VHEQDKIYPLFRKQKVRFEILALFPKGKLKTDRTQGVCWGEIVKG